MDGCIGRYYFEGTIFKETEFLPAEVFETGKCYYEVLRVIDTSCIFLRDHVNRLNKSVRSSGLSFSLELNPVREVIRKLIFMNNMVNGNIRLLLQVKEPAPPLLYTCCVPFSYPGTGQYELGVSTAVYRQVRINPNVKQYFPSYHHQMLAFIAARNVFEALLADGEGYLREGSKSNLFFIRNNAVLTAPGETVLKGITREKIYSLCINLNYNLIETSISIDSLNDMEAVFLTGTSPKILPVCRIDNLSFGVDHPMMRKLMEAYDGLIFQDMEQNHAV